MSQMVEEVINSLKNILKKIYYIPFEKKRKSVSSGFECWMPQESLYKSFYSSKSGHIYATVSSSSRINRIKRLIPERLSRCFDEWVLFEDCMSQDRGKFVLFELDKYSKMSEVLYKNGLKEGLDYYLLIDPDLYRRTYPKTGKQNNWLELERMRKKNKSHWINRIALMRDMIGTENTSVLDIGCWESELREMLPDTVRYYGCDYIKRDKDTIVCDLNAKEFPDISFDVAFISGSLEYMEHLSWYFDQISKARNEIIISYSSIEYFPMIDDRMSKSWVNHLTFAELAHEMEIRGFGLSDSSHWGKWTIILKFIRL